MPDLPGFCNASYVQTATEVDVEDCVNLYPENQESPFAKSKVVLYGSPGTQTPDPTQTPATISAGPIRAMVDSEGFTDVLSGPEYWRINPDGSVLAVGLIANDGLPGKIIASTTQVLILSANVVYCNNGGTFAAIASPPWTNPIDIAMSDGFGIVLDDSGPVGGQFFISALNDFTSWDPLDFSTAPVSNNRLVALATDHDEVWIFGTKVTQVFSYNGSALFPFVLNASATVQQGTYSATTVQQLDNTLIWVGQNKDGTLQAFVADGYRPLRISDHPTEQQWAKYPNPISIVTWCYQINGHPVYHINFVEANKSWRYDRSTQKWHRVAWKDPVSGIDYCHRGNSHVVRLGTHIIGDRQTGNLYLFSPQVNEDANPTGTNPLVGLRRCMTPFAGNKTVFYSLFEIITPAGIGVPNTPDSNPAWMLRWSNDSGHTWSSEYQLQAGQQAQYTQRLRKVGVGSARNRVFEVSISANVPRCLIAAEYEGTVGLS